MQKSLILLVFLTSLTACADRERLNCPPIKNKALRNAGEVIIPTTPAPAYGTGGKC